VSEVCTGGEWRIDMKKKRPKQLYVAFYKTNGSRCCTDSSLRGLLESHPADEYDVEVYVLRKKTRP
jgi:hypothetical protein